jgi:hypothetical protein
MNEKLAKEVLAIADKVLKKRELSRYLAKRARLERRIRVAEFELEALRKQLSVLDQMVKSYAE